jgi:hypothetical protein
MQVGMREQFFPRQVQTAFVAEAGDVQPGVIIEHEAGRLKVWTVSGDEIVLDAQVPDDVEAFLARDDVTRRGGHPLVLVHTRRGLLGVAWGPVDAPERIGVVGALDLETNSMLGTPAELRWRLFHVEVHVTR